MNKNKYGEWETLNEEQKDLLDEAIIEYLPSRLQRVNSKVSSYGLKHKFEKILGFYVSNLDMKEAMIRLEYRNNGNNQNQYYNISSRELKRIDKMLKEGF